MGYKKLAGYDMLQEAFSDDFPRVVLAGSYWIKPAQATSYILSAVAGDPL